LTVNCSVNTLTLFSIYCQQLGLAKVMLV